MNNTQIINWIPDEIIKNCANCLTSFGLLTRKSHCRNCGKIYCKNCIQVLVINYNQTKLCISCYEKYDKNINDIMNNEIQINNDTTYYEKIIEEKNTLINDLKNELTFNFDKNNKSEQYYKKCINDKNILIDNLENKLTFNCDKYTQTDFSNKIISNYLEELDDSVNIYDSANDIDDINNIDNFNTDLTDNDSDIETQSPNSVMISSTKDIVLQRKFERQKLLEDEYNKQVNKILDEKNEDKKYYNY